MARTANALAKAAQPTVERVDDSTIVVTARGKAYTMKELNGLVQSRADKMASGDSGYGFITMRAVFAITHIDGAACLPLKNNVEVNALLQRIPGPVVDRLAGHYAKAFSIPDDELENESTDDESQPS